MYVVEWGGGEVIVMFVIRVGGRQGGRGREGEGGRGKEEGGRERE